MKVMKFGGTSVGKPQRMHEVAKLITTDNEAKDCCVKRRFRHNQRLVAISSLLAVGNRDHGQTEH